MEPGIEAYAEERQQDGDPYKFTAEMASALGFFFFFQKSPSFVFGS
jgi:hypothetical protein